MLQSFTIVLAAACSAIATATARPFDLPTSDWNAREHIPIEKFVIQSHRGAGELAPENTPEAFELGWKLGTYPEADLRTTKDSIIVAFHDEKFSRVVRNLPTAFAELGVKDLTWEQLSQLEVGAWKGAQLHGRVAKIADIFAIMKGKTDRKLYLDIKNVDLRLLAQDVQDHQVAQQVILASTDYSIIRQWKALLPQSQTLLWMGGSEDQLRRRLHELETADFADVAQLQIHVHLTPDAIPKQAKPGRWTPSDEFLLRVGKQLRSRDILFQALPYGGASEQVYWKLLDLGVMSFATDHPEVTLDAVRKYYRRDDDGSKGQ